MRELRALQLQLEEIKKAQEKSDVIGDSTTGQETDNKDQQKSETKTEEKTEQIDDINAKIDNDFRVSLEKKYQKMVNLNLYFYDLFIYLYEIFFFEIYMKISLILHYS